MQTHPDDQDRVLLTREEADAMLKPGADVHTFMQGAAGPGSSLVLIGADRRREELLAYADNGLCELAGPSATGMNHGVVVFTKVGPVFCETNELGHPL